jgi:hypothetical protein
MGRSLGAFNLSEDVRLSLAKGKIAQLQNDLFHFGGPRPAYNYQFLAALGPFLII